MSKVLVVDDEDDIRELIELSLLRLGVSCDCAATVGEARDFLAQNTYRLCLTDMRLPDGDGLELVAHIQKHCAGLPVAVISAYGSIETAIRAMKMGAFDFVTKPVDLKALRELVKHAMQLDKNGEASGKQAEEGRKLIGRSAVIMQLRGQIEKLARNQAPVYIHGESGTGKEVVARLIHALGPRAAGPFVPVNCGAIPAELMESEFFGHCKGSFTGATADKEGLFQAARGGTLFLDEVADLPLGMQVKLLRAIQERAVRRVGGQAEEAVDVRLLSASHRDLAKLVEDNRFRQDLYFRINVISLQVPPLRERRDDIAGLAQHILLRLAEQNQMPLAQLQPEALLALQQHDFPGNVRELENLLERACALCDDNCITPQDLNLLPAAGAAVVIGQAPAAAVVTPSSARAARVPLGEARIEAASRALGLTPHQLRYRMRKWNLALPD